jgi:hypothetical protein
LAAALLFPAAIRTAALFDRDRGLDRALRTVKGGNTDDKKLRNKTHAPKKGSAFERGESGVMLTGTNNIDNDTPLRAATSHQPETRRDPCAAQRWRKMSSKQKADHRNARK